MKVEGIAEISAKLFIENLPKFYEFYDTLGIKCKGIKTDVNTDIKTLSIFKDKKVLFSGFRNKDHEKIITDSGGKIVTSISKSTNYLIVKDKNETSAKIAKAIEFNIKILDINDLAKLLKN
jgi:NAD-dependent DNA ligase